MADSSLKLTFNDTNEKGLNMKFKKSKLITLDSDTSMAEWTTVTIAIKEYRNIHSVYPSGNIKTTCEFDGTIIGETRSLPLIFKDTLELRDSFSLRINNKCPKDIDNLLSLPAILTVHQLASDSLDYNIDEQLMCTPATPVDSIKSMYDVYEAILDEKFNFALEDKVIDKREKSLKKTTKKSTSSIEARKSEISNIEFTQSHPKPKSIKSTSVIYGMCVIDFLPLFRGKRKFSEALPIKALERFEDDRMVTYKRTPTVVIDVSIDIPLNYDENTLVYFTLESIYNLPPPIAEEMTCTVAMHFPSFENSVCGPILFKNAVLTTDEQPMQFKCWPNLPPQGDNANTTKYGINPGIHDVLCQFPNDFNKCLQHDAPRLVFNMIKRVLMDEQAVDKLRSQGETFKHLLMELYFVEQGSYIGNSLKTPTKLKKEISDLHCMALVKMSTLMHPGETKLRIAVPIKTFSMDEVKNSVGIYVSMFAPLLKKKQLVRTNKHHSSKDVLKDKEKEKVVKVSRHSQTARPDDRFDWRRRVSQLTLDSGAELYYDTSLPTFAVVEIQLTNPIVPKLDSKSLNNRLEMLLRTSKPHEDEEGGSSCEELFRDRSNQEDFMQFHVTYSSSTRNFEKAISTVLLDMKGKLERYLHEKMELEGCPDLPDYSSFDCSQFFEFLDKIGVYNTYDGTIRDALALMAHTASTSGESCACDVTKSSKVDLLFRDALNAIHRAINQLSNVERTEMKRDTYLFAKEALEMEMIVNGERILLERLCTDDQNADYWAEYAIFLTETNRLEEAMECFHEGILRNPDHKYCSLMYGMLLEECNQRSEAETVLLNVVTKEPTWFEGWGVLYLFYKRRSEDGDIQRYFERAKECLDVYTEDNIFHFVDLTYCSMDTQQSIHSRLVWFLIKVRMFSWAEVYMASITREVAASDMTFLSAVMSYYKRDYEKCINVLEDVLETRKISVMALQAHCLVYLGRAHEALEYYRAILLKPHHHPSCQLMRVVTLKCAKVLIENSSEKHLNEARQILYKFCECELSPLAWLLLGITYYMENCFQDSIYCFKAGNLLDYSNGNIWVLLALANFKLNNHHKANDCVYQAIQYQFDYDEYARKLEEELKAACDEDEEELSE